jgi:hypothetical protein
MYRGNSVSIIIDAIQFNHQPDAAGAVALSIRRNGKRSVTRPEWRRGVCHKPEDSPAAYPLTMESSQVCRIRARFRRTDPAGAAAVDVRAIQDDSCGKNVLGDVGRQKVRFGPDDLSDLQTFELSHHRLAKVGVGVWTVAWLWQYRSRGRWVTFDRTEHRVFTTLGVPVEPWQQEPFQEDNICIPWAEALEYACRWAHGAKTPNEAATAITTQIHYLGSALLQYNCQLPGNGVYGFFSLSSFLDLLSGGAGRGPVVGCTDCSCAVVVFANLLGCDLWKVDINTDPLDGSDPPAPQFKLNPILVIGSTQWGIPCGLTGFGFHSVACKGELTPDDRLFDACLRLDGDADPTAADPNHTPIVPANMRYGSPGSGDYLDRLVHPDSRSLVVAQGWGRLRPNIFDN